MQSYLRTWITKYRKVKEPHCVALHTYMHHTMVNRNQIILIFFYRGSPGTPRVWRFEPYLNCVKFHFMSGHLKAQLFYFSPQLILICSSEFFSFIKHPLFLCTYVKFSLLWESNANSYIHIFTGIRGNSWICNVFDWLLHF